MVERRKSGDIISNFWIMTCKDKMNPRMWFMIDANSKRRGIINKTEYLNFEKSLKNNLELRKTSSVRGLLMIGSSRQLQSTPSRIT